MRPLLNGGRAATSVPRREREPWWFLPDAAASECALGAIVVEFHGRGAVEKDAQSLPQQRASLKLAPRFFVHS
jgi:hypothetical protein